jgi:PAS domain S-box-containing protein
MQKGRTIIPHEKNSKASFLEGGGEMGELIRAFDWNKTPLGGIENWSQSLKNTVALILNNRFPMLLWWGPDYISIYNDAYIPILGTKHPWGLGKPVKECWSEIWNILKPLIDIPFSGGEATWMDDISLLINRKNFIEETHFTIAYSPVPDTNAPGGIGGVLATVNEITESVIEKRQMETLKELGKNLSSVLVENEVYIKAVEALSINLADLPFSLVYKIEHDKSTASLIAASGIEKDHPELIPVVDLKNPIRKTKNIALAANENKIVESENDGRWKNLPKGIWDVMPQRYVHIPVKTASKFPCAILSVGLNPYRQLNDSYKNFIKLIADQLSLCVSNALAYEAERKRAEALAEIDKAKTVFFSNISHEFRTPLTLMLGPLEDLLNRTQSRLTDEERDKIETTHRNSMRLLRLVNNLLDFSRIEAGRAKAQFQLTDISKFTRDVAGSFRSAIENAGLHFNVNCEIITQPVYVDRSMWEKIVLNLLSNAFKYTFTGSITVSLSTRDNKVELSIADTGVGIPQEELPNLFQRFHRVQNVTGRTYEGTGIGLSLVSEFVKMHGGNISVRTRVNEGSVFVTSIPTGRMHLPVEQIVESEIDAEVRLADAFLEEADSLIGAPVHIKTDPTKNVHDASHILVVDDNPDMREYLKNVLDRSFTIVTAENGSDALQKMQEQAPQLVISDVMMPVMDGIQLLKAIKENKKFERIPVILLTARAGEESRIEGYQVGADDYLVKPFSTKELLARITAQLSMHKKIEENEKQLEYFIKKAPVGIVIYRGPDFTVEEANDRVLEMWGKTFNEVKGRTLTDLFPEIISQETARAMYEASVEKFLKGETFVVNEAPFAFQRNGQPYKGWYNCTYEPIKDLNGNSTGIIAVVTEVTDQVVARKKIEESEEKFRTLATEFPLFVWLTDHNLQTTFLNRTGLEYFDVPHLTNIRELSWKKFIHPDDLEKVLAVMNDAARRQKSYTLTMRLKNGRTGQYRWFVDNGMPQFVNGKFSGFIGTSMDIHEQKNRG